MSDVKCSENIQESESLEELIEDALSEFFKHNEDIIKTKRENCNLLRNLAKLNYEYCRLNDKYKQMLVKNKDLIKKTENLITIYENIAIIKIIITIL